MQETVRYYVEVLGFQCARHFETIENFATVYRDAIELVIVQSRHGTVESNMQCYGAGYDAYIATVTLDGVEALYREFQQKGVNLLTAPHITGYGSREFTFSDCDGRILDVGLIADKNTFFRQSNYV